jgi:hypothetical protein
LLNISNSFISTPLFPRVSLKSQKVFLSGILSPGVKFKNL